MGILALDGNQTELSAVLFTPAGNLVSCSKTQLNPGWIGDRCALNLHTPPPGVITTGIENTLSTRHDLREWVVTTPGLGAALSGVLLDWEGLGMSTSAGTPFPVALLQQNVLTGVRLYTDVAPLSPGDPESSTRGLDGLQDRVDAAVAAGASFGVWRTQLTPATTANPIYPSAMMWSWAVDNTMWAVVGLVVLTRDMGGQHAAPNIAGVTPLCPACSAWPKIMVWCRW